MKKTWISTLGLLLAMTALFGIVGNVLRASSPDTRTNVAAAMSQAPGVGFKQALAPREFEFPRDHGPHNGFRTEWWYFTGHLENPTAESYGYQLTMFRVGLDPTVEPSSAWRVDHLILAHFALTDVNLGHFHSAEKLTRANLGIAGSSGEPARIWIDDWSIRRDPPSGTWRLKAAQDGYEIDLTLNPERPATLHGEAGLSRKSPQPGNASYYYSITRMASRGRLCIRDACEPVSGSSWLDREWSTSALGASQAGWDWFAIQLANGTEIMLYRMREKGRSQAHRLEGTLVTANGSAPIAGRSISMYPITRWKSPKTGRTYPHVWRIKIAPLALDLTITPTLAEQEWRGLFPYWEGSATVFGSIGHETTSGRAYIEMTGY